jgi:hypothetical protein
MKKVAIKQSTAPLCLSSLNILAYSARSFFPFFRSLFRNAHGKRARRSLLGVLVFVRPPRKVLRGSSARVSHGLQYPSRASCFLPPRGFADESAPRSNHRAPAVDPAVFHCFYLCLFSLIGDEPMPKKKPKKAKALNKK